MEWAERRRVEKKNDQPRIRVVHEYRQIPGYTNGKGTKELTPDIGGLILVPS